MLRVCRLGDRQAAHLPHRDYDRVVFTCGALHCMKLQQPDSEVAPTCPDDVENLLLRF